MPFGADVLWVGILVILLAILVLVAILRRVFRIDVIIKRLDRIIVLLEGKDDFRIEPSELLKRR